MPGFGLGAFGVGPFGVGEDSGFVDPALIGTPSDGTVAQPLCFISFDVDPLDCPLATGTDATMEGANSWAPANGNTVDVINSSRSHAGEKCTQLTRTATAGPLQEFWQSAVGTVAAGRWYGALLYLQPGTTARTGQIGITFQTAASGTLTSVTSSAPEIAGQWRPLAVLAQAPTGVSVSRLRVDITIPGCAVGEQHYYDTFTCDHLGTDVSVRVRSAPWRRGRTDELGPVQASTCAVTLKNEDGYLTPDGTTAPAPYLNNIDSGRRLALWRRVGGVVYPEWTGTTEAWEQSVHANGRWSEVEVQCTDGFAYFSKPVLPPLPAEIMLDEPDSYFRLSEAKGSVSAGSIAGDSSTLTFAASKYGSLGSDFGADNASRVLDTGKTADDGQSWLSLNPSATLNGAGNVLDLSTVPAANPISALTTGWTAEIWVQPPTTIPAEDMILFRSTRYSGGNDVLSGIQIVLGTDARVRVFTPSQTLLTTTFGYLLGAALPIVVTWTPTGGTWGTVSLLMGGGIFETRTAAPTANPFGAGAPDRMWIGGDYKAYFKTLANAWRAPVAHVAFWKRALPDTRTQPHGSVGMFGGGDGENEGNRIGGVANLVGWPAAWTRVDIGLSDLMDRSWGETSALTLIQDIARQTSAVVFVDAAGKLVVRNRHQRVNSAVQAFFRAADGTPIAARDFKPRKDDQFVENSIRVTRTQGATTVASDATSIHRYGEKPAGDQEVAVNSEEEAAALGKWRIATRKDNRARVASLVLQPGARPALWPICLTLEVGDRISVQGLPDLAPSTTLDCFVESIDSNSQGSPRDVEYTLGLSPWRLDLHQMAELDTGTDLSLLGQPECKLGWY